MIDEEEATH